MKIICSLSILILFFQPLQAQNLSGRWKGFYTNISSGDQGYILLVIKLQTDSSYEIYSYTPYLKDKLIDTVVVSKVELNVVRKNYYRLQEISAENPNNSNLQIMHLKYRKTKTKEILDGNWATEDLKSPQHGFITFTKVEDWKEVVVQ